MTAKISYIKSNRLGEGEGGGGVMIRQYLCRGERIPSYAEDIRHFEKERTQGKSFRQGGGRKGKSQLHLMGV